MSVTSKILVMRGLYKIKRFEFCYISHRLAIALFVAFGLSALNSHAQSITSGYMAQFPEELKSASAPTTPPGLEPCMEGQGERPIPNTESLGMGAGNIVSDSELPFKAKRIYYAPDAKDPENSEKLCLCLETYGQICKRYKLNEAAKLSRLVCPWKLRLSDLGFPSNQIVNFAYSMEHITSSVFQPNCSYWGY